VRRPRSKQRRRRRQSGFHRCLRHVGLQSDRATKQQKYAFAASCVCVCNAAATSGNSPLRKTTTHLRNPPRQRRRQRPTTKPRAFLFSVCCFSRQAIFKNEGCKTRTNRHRFSLSKKKLRV